jgi:hypothetical protein
MKSNFIKRIVDGITIVDAVIIIFLAILVAVIHDASKASNNVPKDNESEIVIPEPQCLHVVVYMTSLDEYGAEAPTQDNVLSLMCELGIDHPHIVYAQMLLESGHFGSNLAKINHNYFGMKQPSKRRTVSLGKKNGYASYKNWAYSVLDYALWQWNYAKNLTEEEYLALLGRMYAEDANYANKVKTISRSLI